MLVPTTAPIYIATEPADFRKQINGLAGLVRGQMDKNPTDPGLYVFFNKRRDQVKVLYYAPGGFCLWRKRLERGTFARIKTTDSSYISLTTTEVMMLFDGISVAKTRKSVRHQIAERTL